MSLNQQTILITGAAGGLGSTAAITLASQGATIILLDKKIPGLEAVYDQIVAAKDPEPVMYPFDLANANETQYKELATAIENKYGSLQGLLHSAVDSGICGPIAIQKTIDWGNTLNINLNAAFLLSRVLLPLLQKSSTQASIVFTTDSSVRTGKAYTGAYGVAKIALEGFSKILAEELESAQKVRVNTVIPGPVNSPLRKRTHPAEDKDKLATMETLTDIYAYLFGPESTGITGKNIDAQSFNISNMAKQNG